MPSPGKVVKISSKSSSVGKINQDISKLISFQRPNLLHKGGNGGSHLGLMSLKPPGMAKFGAWHGKADLTDFGVHLGKPDAFSFGERV